MKPTEKLCTYLKSSLLQLSNDACSFPLAFFSRKSDIVSFKSNVSLEKVESNNSSNQFWALIETKISQMLGRQEPRKLI